MADPDDPNKRFSLPTPSWKMTLDRIRLQANLFSENAHAPEVDLDLLRALVRLQLTESEARLVHHLIVCFESWQEAHREVLTQEFLRRNDTPD